MKQSVTNLLFDLDGTLTDPKTGITSCIQYALEKLQQPIPKTDDLTWCIGPPLAQSFAKLLRSDDDALLDHAVVLYRERFNSIGMYENSVYPNIGESLQILEDAGFNLFVATFKPVVVAEKILDHFNLRSFFKGVYGSGPDDRLTNKVTLIADILDRENLRAEQTLMIGDRIHDVIGARSNGVKTAFVSYGYGTEEEIRSAEPDLVFDSITQLVSHLQDLHSNERDLTSSS